MSRQIGLELLTSLQIWEVVSRLQVPQIGKGFVALYILVKQKPTKPKRQPVAIPAIMICRKSVITASQFF